MTTPRSKLYGYHGRCLEVGLGEPSGRWRELAPERARAFVGGSGLGAHLLLELGDPPPPLSPEAPLAFVFSPLVGSPLTTSAKFAVVCRSPLTERFSDSLASSAFAIAGKRAAGDALIVRGRAAAASLLLVDDGEVHLEPAADLWGRTIPETEAELKRRFPGFQAAVIGPAGEREIPYATISHDGRHAGRGGSGAVMGSKNLKAILVRGERRVAWADPEGLVALSRSLSDRSFGAATAKYRELGTAANLLAFNRMQTLPTRNFQRGSFAQAEQLAPETLQARGHARQSCAACTIGCEHIYGIGKQGGAKVRVEYESLFSFGSLCEIGDAEAVLGAIARCDELGVDTISFGGTLALAMECVERGWLDEPWLRFGRRESLGEALDHLQQPTDFGRLLAQGSRRLAEHLGPEAEAIAPHVKGLEIPGYAPQGLHSMALGFAVGARGADHNRSGAYEADYSDQVDRRNVQPDQVHLAVATEDRAAVLDSLILCKFLRGTLDEFYEDCASMLRLTTGWDVSDGELRTTAERVVNAKKLYNLRAGWTAVEDTLPPRMLEQPLDDDPQSSLSAEQLQLLVQAYYQCRHWDAQGLPTSETLARLGLEMHVSPTC